MRVILAAYLICLSSLSFGSENGLNSDEAPKTILFWNTEEKLLGFKNIQHILPTRIIKKSSEPYPLSYQLINLDSLTYRYGGCLLYTSPSPRDLRASRMPSSA